MSYYISFMVHSYSSGINASVCVVFLFIAVSKRGNVIYVSVVLILSGWFWRSDAVRVSAVLIFITFSPRSDTIDVHVWSSSSLVTPGDMWESSVPLYLPLRYSVAPGWVSVIDSNHFKQRDVSIGGRLLCSSKMMKHRTNTICVQNLHNMKRNAYYNCIIYCGICLILYATDTII